jgi:hypothetical protein
MGAVPGRSTRSLGITMKLIAKLVALLAFATGPAAAYGGENLTGAWTLRIGDMEHREVAVATIRFSDEPARSCMAGNWKRVIVDSVETKDAKFFPLSQPLSYAIEGSELTIGRNEICDAYLHLRGTFDGSRAHGTYTGFGITGGKAIGEFALIRKP